MTQHQGRERTSSLPWRTEQEQNKNRTRTSSGHREGKTLGLQHLHPAFFADGVQNSRPRCIVNIVNLLWIGNEVKPGTWRGPKAERRGLGKGERRLGGRAGRGGGRKGREGYSRWGEGDEVVVLRIYGRSSVRVMRRPGLSVCLKLRSMTSNHYFRKKVLREWVRCFEQFFFSNNKK